MTVEVTAAPDRKDARIVPAGIEVLGPEVPGARDILTPAALDFVSRLCGTLESRRQELLAARRRRQAEFDSGTRPGFLPETRRIRESEWTVAPIPEPLMDRRVEITGPPDRKMIINALNSGAQVFMADFEDSLSPTWANVISGQLNLRDAIRGTIEFQSSDGRDYRLNPKTAVLMVRPRGWHLNEKHVRIDAQPVSASLFDFGLFFFHNATAQIERGAGPYFYLPKLESHLEARLWNDVFVFAQQALGIRRGTIRATVLIETIPAAFEMDEILYELREHSAGLNCGRWDYIFSVIKKFNRDSRFLLPDRQLVTMITPFMRSYSLLTIRTCHRRRIHAMGGMAAQIPIRNDSAANDAAMQKVRADKMREVDDGHDGTWVAHPGLVPIAADEFSHSSGPNQISRVLSTMPITAADLLDIPSNPRITEQGVRTNVRVGVSYLYSWLCGNGCVPIDGLMEDAATSEISRAQLWQWVHHAARLEDGRHVTLELIDQISQQEFTRLQREIGPERLDKARFEAACELFRGMIDSRDFPQFLTSAAYQLV